MSVTKFIQRFILHGVEGRGQPFINIKNLIITYTFLSYPIKNAIVQWWDDMENSESQSKNLNSIRIKTIFWISIFWVPNPPSFVLEIIGTKQDFTFLNNITDIVILKCGRITYAYLSPLLQHQDCFTVLVFPQVKAQLI